MAIPFLVGAAAAVYGGGKIKSGYDKKKKAESINNEAQEIADNVPKHDF